MAKAKQWLFIFISLLSVSALLGVLPASADNTITVSSIGVTNVRSGPGTGYSIIDRLAPGETVTANGRSSTSNDWLRVDLDGTEGWVSAGVVVLNGDPTTLSVVEPTAAESNVGNTGVVVTIEDNTNIRLGPSTNYPAIGSAYAGDQFDVTGRTEWDARIICYGNNLTDILTDETPEDVWLRINFNGFDAWVNYQVVSVSGNVCDLAAIDANDALADADFPDTGSGVLVVTTSSVNLRASNYAQSDILAVIPYNTTLEAEARDNGGNRIRVTYDGQTGWINLGFVEVARGNVDNLPVEQE
jgi:uncharacterized protein YgiM (DUF1202 family)